MTEPLIFSGLVSDQLQALHYRMCTTYLIDPVLVIQGTLDISKGVSQQEITKTLEFCTNLFDTTWNVEAGLSALEKADKAQVEHNILSLNKKTAAQSEKHQSLTTDEKVALDHINLSKSMRWAENITGETILSDVVEGRKLRLECGRLGLEPAQTFAHSRVAEAYI